MMNRVPTHPPGTDVTAAIRHVLAIDNLQLCMSFKVRVKHKLSDVPTYSLPELVLDILQEAKETT